MKHSCIVFLVATLALSGCVQETMTEVELERTTINAKKPDTITTQDVKMVPIEGFSTGHGWFNPGRTNCPPGSLPLDAAGAGEARHTGEFEIFYEHCSFAQIDPTNPTYVGKATVTAANGDELHLTYNGMATSLTSFLEFNTIDGGTGRFENATGSFVNAGTFGPHPEGYSFDSTFEGTISSVGSSK
jgi:hypothetical protein